MVCASGRRHNGLNVCFMLATPSEYYHYADLLTFIEHIWWNILEACVNACWLYSIVSVYKMYLVLSVTFLIFAAIYGAACVKLVHLSLDDREDIFVTHLVSSSNRKYRPFHSFYIFFGSCMLEMVFTIICCRLHIGEAGFCFFYYCAI